MFLVFWTVPLFNLNIKTDRIADFHAIEASYKLILMQATTISKHMHACSFEQALKPQKEQTKITFDLVTAALGVTRVGFGYLMANIEEVDSH